MDEEKGLMRRLIVMGMNKHELLECSVCEVGRRCFCRAWTFSSGNKPSQPIRRGGRNPCIHALSPP